MKQRKNKLIKLLAGVALCTALVSTATGVALADTPATVNEPDYTLTMTGAEIRTDDHYGIRFVATAQAVRETSDYYVMIVPETWLADDDHNLQSAVDGDYYAHLIGKGLKDVDDPDTPADDRDFITMETTPEKISDNLYEVKGTISNVKFHNSNTKFFGIAYEQIDNETRNYAERVYESGEDKSIRSICWVAGAALNDENFDGDKTNLKGTIDRAYDYLTDEVENNETLDLSTIGFKQNAYYTLDKGSVTPLEMTGLPKGLDLPIEYSVANYNADVAPDITPDGVLTVKGETGCAFVKARIAGENKNLTVYNTPQMAEGMLQDFASHDGSNRTYAMNIGDINTTDQSNQARGSWLESYIDAYGNIGYGVGMATKYHPAVSCALRLNASKAELDKMNIETITVRFCATSPNEDIAKLSVSFFGGGFVAYPVNAWSYYTFTKPTDEVAWDAFLDMYCNTGGGRITGSNNGGCQNFCDNDQRQGNVTFYIDYVSVGTIRMESHELENFNVSSTEELRNSITSQMAWPSANNNSEIVGTQADNYGNNAYNVAKLSMGGYGYSTMRFARTAEQLTTMMETLDSITWRVMVDKDVTFTILGKSVELTAMKWTNVTLTKAELLANFTGQTTEAEKINHFASVFCSTGGGNTIPRMFGVPSEECPVVLYVDGVTYTTTTAE